jgi:hypothetical protein
MELGQNIREMAKEALLALSYELDSAPQVFLMYDTPIIGKADLEVDGVKVQRRRTQEMIQGLKERDLLYTEPILEGEVMHGNVQEQLLAQTILYRTPVPKEALYSLQFKSLMLLEKAKRDLAHARYSAAQAINVHQLSLEKIVFDLDQPSDVNIRAYPVLPLTYSLLFMAAKERYESSSEPVSIADMLNLPRTDLEALACALHPLLEKDMVLPLGEAQLFFQETRNMLRKRFKL